MGRPAKTWTVKALENLRVPPGKRMVNAYIGDGLVLRKLDTGLAVWLLRYRSPERAGAERTVKLGEFPEMKLSAATADAAEKRKLIDKGVDPVDAEAREREAADDAHRKRGSRAFTALCARYLDEHATKHKRSAGEDARKIARDLLPAWGHREAGSITRADVRALLAMVAAGKGPGRRSAGTPAPVAANRILALISKLYTFAVNEEFPGVTGNPAWRLPKLPERARARVLSDAEIVAFWKASETEGIVNRAAVRLLLLCPLRRSELLGAKWNDVQEDELGAWIEVPAERSKNGRPIRAPLSTLAREVLAGLSVVRESPAEWLFPSVMHGKRLTDLKATTLRLARRMGSEPWTVHDLRRTARTRLSALGVSVGIAERLLGHKAPEARGVGAVYDRHEYARERMAAAETLGRHVRALVTGEAAGRVLDFQRGG